MTDEERAQTLRIRKIVESAAGYFDAMMTAALAAERERCAEKIKAAANPFREEASSHEAAAQGGAECMREIAIRALGDE